jgi:hypothetical protein
MQNGTRVQFEYDGRILYGFSEQDGFLFISDTPRIPFHSANEEGYLYEKYGDIKQRCWYIHGPRCLKHLIVDLDEDDPDCI